MFALQQQVFFNMLSVYTRTQCEGASFFFKLFLLTRNFYISGDVCIFLLLIHNLTPFLISMYIKHIFIFLIWAFYVIDYYKIKAMCESSTPCGAFHLNLVDFIWTSLYRGVTLWLWSHIKPTGSKCPHQPIC